VRARELDRRARALLDLRELRLGHGERDFEPVRAAERRHGLALRDAVARGGEHAEHDAPGLRPDAAAVPALVRRRAARDLHQELAALDFVPVRDVALYDRAVRRV